MPRRIEQARLGIDPVLHRDHGEVRAVDLARVRVDVHGPGRAETRAQVVDADDEEAVGVHGLAGADHGVPPAFRLFLARVDPRHVVRSIQRVADQYRVALVGIEAAVGFVGQRIAADRRAALQGKRLAELHRLRNGDKRHEKTRRR